MKKLKMQTPNITEQNIEQIAKLFPNVMTESQDEKGNTKRAIDFDLLKQSLSSVLVDDADERYRLDWPGKKAALLKANTPITKTLRPCREDSVNFDSTENVYIEGDNFEVLKILQESYLGKIKMIYIDPPYNTGKDFIYKDNYTAKKADYEEELGTTDEDDNKLFKNTDTNGRFHSDWLSMMYERLVVARDLLKEDGVIFISIDDNEVHNLREICDEVFGDENFVAQLTIIVKPEGRRYGFFAKTHDYMLVYCKNNEHADLNEILIEGLEHPHSDDLGGFTLKGLRNRNVQTFNSTNRPNLRYPFFVEKQKPDANGFFKVSTIPLAGFVKVEASTVDGLQSVWRWGKEKSEKEKDSLLAYEGNDGEIRISQKERKLSQMAKTVLVDKEIISNKGTKELQVLLGKGIFDFPKPVALIRLITTISSQENDIILDFFSGSATTAHAVMKLNAEDNGNRKFIMVQLPEATDEKSEAYKAGYKTIAEIGKERIRRAGKKIVNDELLIMNEGNNSQSSIHNSQLNKLDTGFRVYKTDSSNMKEVYYHPTELNQNSDLEDLISNIKADRTPDDLLTQVILDLGLELNLPIEQKNMHGNSVFIVQTNALVACFDDNINVKIIDDIAALSPFKVVFKDASFTASKDRINLEERFKRLSPETLITVI